MSLKKHQIALLSCSMLLTTTSLHAATNATAAAKATEEDVEVMVVTSSRQAQALTNLAETVSVLDEATIKAVSPGHPAELLNRVSGVHVNDLGGEGHMTAIRQPITTVACICF